MVIVMLNVLQSLKIASLSSKMKFTESSVMLSFDFLSVAKLEDHYQLLLQAVRAGRKKMSNLCKHRAKHDKAVVQMLCCQCLKRKQSYSCEIDEFAFNGTELH